jgi:uncharacterized protein
MIERPFWLKRMDLAWRHVPILWLTGVRRAGKTVLARSLPGAAFVNCDLPSSAARLEDPERFFRALNAPMLILDEVHQLPDPSRLLKIAADAFPPAEGAGYGVFDPGGHGQVPGQPHGP